MTKIALCIGIDHYDWAPLKGCVADAKSMSETLKYHDNEERNFTCKTLLSSTDATITERKLRKEIHDFFKRPADVALFFFAGHGGENDNGGYIMPQDADKYDLGFPFSELIECAVKSEIRDIFIILDCCHAGKINEGGFSGVNIGRPGISILTASLPEQYSGERGGRGLFSSIIEMGLKGNAADLLGNVTAAGLYNYADQMLGPFVQRPMFKTHVSGFKVLRKCKAKISKQLLRKLPDYFPEMVYQYPLDPSYEPTAEPSHPENEAKFAELQKYVQAGLVEPVGEEHMYYAAMNSTSCQLTNAGKAYWSIAEKDLL